MGDASPAGALGLVVLAVVAVLYVTPSDDYLFLPVAAQPLAPKVHVEGGKPETGGGGIYYDEVHIRKASILESHFPGLVSGSTLVPGDLYLPRARPRSSSSRPISRTWSARRRSPPRSRSARRATR